MLIVTYHAIADRPSPISATAEQLEHDLTALLEAGFTFASLDDCADWLDGKRTLPARAAAVTFDDAYASVVVKGLPVLQRLGVPATVFAIAGRLGGDNQWPGQWRSIPPMPLADRAQLSALAAAGVAIGSHSTTHPDLTALDPERLWDEVEGSATRLEEELRTPVRHFAYPYGFGGPREVAAARRRYRTGVNATSRLVGPGADPHDLHRVDCHDLRMAMRLRCFDAAALDPYLALRRGLRQVRRRADRWLGRV